MFCVERERGRFGGEDEISARVNTVFGEGMEFLDGALGVVGVIHKAKVFP